MEEPEEIIDLINKVVSSSVIDLTTNINKDGKLEFPNVRDQVTNIKEVLSHFDENAYELLPIVQKDRFTTILKPLLDTVLSMQDIDYDPTKPAVNQQNRFDGYFSTRPINDPTSASNDQSYAKYIGAIWSIIAESLALKQNQEQPDISDLKKDLQIKQNTVEGMIKEIEKATKRIKNQSVEVSRIVQEEMSKAGIGTHAQIFHAEAEKNETVSKGWLKWGLILLGAALVIIAGLAITYFGWVRSSDDVISNIEYGILTALVISFISYGVYICFRNYFAEKHNQKVNQHKANCLSTYFTFIESADDLTRQAILQYTTQTIYSHQPTGYTGKGSDIASNPNPIVEIIKNIAPNAKDNVG